jgi:hypothetical protein
MRNVRGSFRTGIAVVLLISSFNITACGGRLKPGLTQAAPATTTPGNNFYDNINQPTQDYYNSPTNNQYGSASIINAAPNATAGSFKVDQATFNQWQARGIAVSSGTIYVSVADTNGLSKKGSIVKMNSSDGKSWKDLTSSLMGLRHPLDATVTGLAVSGGSIIAVDSASKVYSVDASSGDVKVIKTAGGTDVAAGGGSVFIANGSVEKSDTSASSRVPIMGLTASGGVGSDNMGNVYAVSGNTIKKADIQGQVMDIVTTNLSGAIDVAADSRNGDIYVLESSMIKRFNANGQLMASFANGATKAIGIAVDESGAVYVADAGSNNKDSKVNKFAAATDAIMNSQMNRSNTINTTNPYGNNGYGTYSNTRY